MPPGGTTAERIMHIADRAVWNAALAAGEYRGDTLDSEGFIHCSYGWQVAETASSFFRGKQGLVLLCIDPGRLTSPLRIEPGTASPEDRENLFPHIYGPLNPDAVTQVLDFPPSWDGTFALPPELAQ